MPEQRPVYSSRLLVTAAIVLLIPLAGLALLVRRPQLDVHWENHPAHFWLVLGTAALSAALAYAMSVAASRRGDGRLLLVSLAFVATAGFLGLHALATPGVLLQTPNAGFTLATPIGLALGSVLAAWSTVDLSGQQAVNVMRLGRRLRIGLVVVIALWAAASLAQVPPLHQAGVPERANGILTAIAVPTIVLYCVAAIRYVRLWRQRPSLMLLSMMSACVLLAEATVAIVVATNWALSWWEWHLLMLAAFALVAAGAQVQWHEERFADLYLEDTLAGNREISVLFADLEGFTSFSESHEPAEVTAMLNAYFALAVPPIVGQFRGDVERIIGDALMVTFNKRGDQPDHATLAAAAGLALQESTAGLAADHPAWPRFRVGVNSGPVALGVLGTQGARTHTVIGDIVNVASRIEAIAPAGGVAIGPGTKAQLPDAHTESLGILRLKGKSEPLEVFRLIAMDRNPA
ncbi:MAG TPA: adenylate/guanylate cyclase domain-containing protein [Jiangellaceae bacterium]|jgi:class 3 adenylate cyclase|nr:adenylate/guanylate cyclase domain-containing protein [Jiangellaceae bacterium]